METFYFAEDPANLSPELRGVLQEQAVHVRQINKGWTRLQTSGGQVFSLFVPSQKSRDTNERSIAVFAGQGDDGVLLTADLGKHGLQQLIDAGLPGRATLLKLPHHGSRHAYPELYLEKIKPTVAFTSAGRGNTYGFPHHETIEACTSRQTPLFRTDREGMLTFRLHNGQWQTDTGRLYN